MCDRDLFTPFLNHTMKQRKGLTSTISQPNRSPRLQIQEFRRCNFLIILLKNITKKNPKLTNYHRIKITSSCHFIYTAGSGLAWSDLVSIYAAFNINKMGKANSEDWCVWV